MQRISHIMFRVLSVGGIVLGLTLLSTRAVTAAVPIPDIELVRVENVTETYEVRDYDGRLVRVVQPAQSMRSVRTDNKDGLVRGTLTTADPATREVKVRTQAGQTLVLRLSPSMFQAIEVGAPIEIMLPAHVMAQSRP